MRLMAVWAYDLPPYYLAAEIEEIKPDGIVKVKGFDIWVRPVKILPFDQGRIDSLKSLGVKYTDRLHALRKEIRHNAEKLMFLR